MSTYKLICSDVTAGLRQLPDQSVNCCVTSPPYWGLRAYGTEPQVWDGDVDCRHIFDAELPHGRRGNRGISGTGGNLHPTLDESGQGAGAGGGGQFCSLCSAWRGEFGLEPTPQLYIDHLVQIFREVRRVLTDNATVWLNLGDSYAGSWGNQGRKEDRGRQRPINGDMIQPVHDGRYASKQSNTGKIPEGSGLKNKDLVGIPWMAAFALRADGWYLRQDIIWHKSAPMPESVRDRCTKAHEYVFLLSKRERYYFDADAIAEEAICIGDERHLRTDRRKEQEPFCIDNGSRARTGKPQMETRNKRSVWTIGPQPFQWGDDETNHFAVMPEALVDPCIIAGCPEGGTVLDVFTGSGTVGVAALKSGRNFVGTELNPDYVKMARRRLSMVAPMFHEEFDGALNHVGSESSEEVYD